MKEIPNPLEDADFADFDCPYCGIAVSFPTADIGTLKQCPTCLESMIVPKPGAPAEKVIFPIETARLLIRRFRPADKEDLFALMSNEETLRYLRWEPYGEEEIDDWLAHDKHLSFPHSDTSIYFALQTTDTGRMIGLSFFWFPYEGFNTGEFVVVIHPAWRRQGFGSEAARGLFSYAFDGFHVHRMMAGCDARDVAGRRMLLKAGMRLEGKFRKNELVKSQWVDTLGFGLLREEYQTRPPKKQNR